MADFQQIQMEQLVTGRWYVGRGRNGNIGLWNGECFLVIGQAGVMVSAEPRQWRNRWVIKQESYFTESSGCFQPFVAINEGEVAESLNGASSPYGYARALRFVSSGET